MDATILSELSLLYVDDDEIILFEAEAAIGELFGRFSVAKNGEEALKIFSENSFDVVITDITMPIKNGVELCREIKTMNPKQRILAASSTDDTKHIIELINININRFFSKPMNYEVLVEYLMEVASNLLNERNLKIYQEQIERKNRELTLALDELKATQHKLVESEKMASLGMLVSGVAHELNTPLGIAITSYTMIKDRLHELQEKFKDGSLKKSDMEKYFDTFNEADVLIFGNLERSAKLVQAFKQISIDEHIHNKQPIDIYEMLMSLTIVYQAELKKRGITINVKSNSSKKLNSYKEVFETLFSKLIENSIDHAFNQTSGEKFINIQSNDGDGEITIAYSDNGKGIPVSEIKNIFVPFYTTARSSSKLGLGLSIVYNLITQKLGGTIELDEKNSIGVRFIIKIPNR